MPSEYWTNERLKEAAINELLRHGGNKIELALLLAEFGRMNKDNKRSQSEQVKIAGDIPS